MTIFSTSANVSILRHFSGDELMFFFPTLAVCLVAMTGIWADEDSDEGRPSFGGHGHAKKDFTAPMNFVSGGVKVGDSITKTEEKQSEDDNISSVRHRIDSAGVDCYEDNKPSHCVLPPGHWRLKLKICRLFHANMCKFDAEIKSYKDGKAIWIYHNHYLPCTLYVQQQTLLLCVQLLLLWSRSRRHAHVIR